MWGLHILAGEYFLWVQFIIGKNTDVKKDQKILAVVGFCICYLGMIYLPQFLKILFGFESSHLKFLQYVTLQIFLAAGILYYVKKVEKRDLTSIGFKRFKAGRDIMWGLIGFGLGGLSFAVTGPIVALLELESTIDGIMKLLAYPMWMRLGMAITAGVTEEILLRTYPIERIKEWTGSIWLAALISIILFGGLHIPFWSLGGAIQIGVGTIIWTLIYIKVRSIWPMIIMHVLNDILAFVALPIMFGQVV